MASPPLTHRRVLALAVPIMVSNASTPLLGVVDTAVVGRLPDPAHIGGVALGALVFTFVFWGFGFLRMGTTGMTAQALGADDQVEVRASLGRALMIAVAAGLAIVALSWPITELAFALLDGPAEAEALARGYVGVRIWAAPATLLGYSLLGWFIGLGRTRTALGLTFLLNLTNMGLDALFVLGLGWGVEGVALGTAIAEHVAAGAGLVVAAAHLRTLGGRWERGPLFAMDRLRSTLAIHRDIMIRSLALVSAFGFFVAQGASMGEVLLAANAVLMHFVNVAAYFLDGVAFAAESLVGHAVGARDRAQLRVAAVRTTTVAVSIAIAVSVSFALFGPWIIDAMTVDPGARAAARIYLPWAAAAPVAGVWAYQLDGFFIGATRGPEMRNAMLVSLAVFLAGWWLLRPLGNHGLWAALFVHYAARAASLLFYYPRLARVLAPQRA